MRLNIVNNTVRAVILLCILMTSLTLGAAETVNINRADTATMIENWKGIGEVKAKAIVAYRKKNGPFKSIDELSNVKGIGDGLIKKNRKLMSINRGTAKPSGNAKRSTDQRAKKTTTKKSDKKKAGKKKANASSAAPSSKNKKSKTTQMKETKSKSNSKKPSSKNTASKNKSNKKK